MKIKLFIYENHMQTILVILWHCINCIQNDETHNNIKKNVCFGAIPVV